VANGTYFLSECPTCARKLEIRVELLGKRVSCQSCGAIHVASNIVERSVNDQRIEQVLARAKAYIASVDTCNPTATE
jgi:uncharacterized Zn finger protein